MLLLTAVACRQKDAPLPNLGYSYAPATVGNWIEYDITEIYLDAQLEQADTFHYQLREVKESRFNDDQNRPSIRLERYIRTDVTQPWVIHSVWYSTRTERGFETMEENLRYLRLVFPVNADQRWNGNVHNTLSNWNYRYLDLHRPMTIGGLSYDSTLTVLQRNVRNFVEQQHAFEIYAAGRGLVQKKLVDVTLINGDTSNVRKGQKYYQTATAFGFL